MTDYIAMILAWIIFVSPVGWIIFSFGKALDECGTRWRWTTVISLLALPLYFGIIIQLLKDLTS